MSGFNMIYFLHIERRFRYFTLYFSLRLHKGYNSKKIKNLRNRELNSDLLRDRQG